MDQEEIAPIIAHWVHLKQEIKSWHEDIIKDLNNLSG